MPSLFKRDKSNSISSSTVGTSEFGAGGGGDTISRTTSRQMLSSSASSSNVVTSSNGNRRQSMGGIPEEQQQSTVRGKRSSAGTGAGKPLLQHPPSAKLHSLRAVTELLNARKVYRAGYLYRLEGGASSTASANTATHAHTHAQERFAKYYVRLEDCILCLWSDEGLQRAQQEGKPLHPTSMNMNDGYVGQVDEGQPAWSEKCRRAGAPTPFCFSLNTAGANSLLFCADNEADLRQWINAIRLAIWERQRLEVLYTATRLGIKEDQLLTPIRSGLQMSHSGAKPGRTEALLDIRLPGDTEWKRVYAVLTEPGNYRDAVRKATSAASAASAQKDSQLQQQQQQQATLTGKKEKRKSFMSSLLGGGGGSNSSRNDLARDAAAGGFSAATEQDDHAIASPVNTSYNQYLEDVATGPSLALFGILSTSGPGSVPNSPSPRQASFSGGPDSLPSSPSLATLPSSSLKLTRRPLVLIQDVYSAHAVWPEHEDLVPHSKIFRLSTASLRWNEAELASYTQSHQVPHHVRAGLAGFEDAMRRENRDAGRAPGEAQLLCMLVSPPPQSNVGGSVPPGPGNAVKMAYKSDTGSELLSWILAIYDAFKLHGRPEKMIYDPRHPLSPYFAQPIGPGRGGLYFEPSLIEDLPTYSDTRPSVISGQLDRMLFERMARLGALSPGVTAPSFASQQQQQQRRPMQAQPEQRASTPSSPPILPPIGRSQDSAFDSRPSQSLQSTAGGAMSGSSVTASSRPSSPASSIPRERARDNASAGFRGGSDDRSVGGVSPQMTAGQLHPVSSRPGQGQGQGQVQGHSQRSVSPLAYGESVSPPTTGPGSMASHAAGHRGDEESLFAAFDKAISAKHDAAAPPASAAGNAAHPNILRPGSTDNASHSRRASLTQLHRRSGSSASNRDDGQLQLQLQHSRSESRAGGDERRREETMYLVPGSQVEETLGASLGSSTSSALPGARADTSAGESAYSGEEGARVGNALLSSSVGSGGSGSEPHYNAYPNRSTTPSSTTASTTAAMTTPLAHPAGLMPGQYVPTPPLSTASGGSAGGGGAARSDRGRAQGQQGQREHEYGQHSTTPSAAAPAAALSSALPSSRSQSSDRSRRLAAPPPAEPQFALSLPGSTPKGPPASSSTATSSAGYLTSPSTANSRDASPSAGNPHRPSLEEESVLSDEPGALYALTLPDKEEDATPNRQRQQQQQQHTHQSGSGALAGVSHLLQQRYTNGNSGTQGPSSGDAQAHSVDSPLSHSGSAATGTHTAPNSAYPSNSAVTRSSSTSEYSQVGTMMTGGSGSNNPMSPAIASTGREGDGSGNGALPQAGSHGANIDRPSKASTAPSTEGHDDILAGLNYLAMTADHEPAPIAAAKSTPVSKRTPKASPNPNKPSITIQTGNETPQAHTGEQDEEPTTPQSPTSPDPYGTYTEGAIGSAPKMHVVAGSKGGSGARRSSSGKGKEQEVSRAGSSSAASRKPGRRGIPVAKKSGKKLGSWSSDEEEEEKDSDRDSEDDDEDEEGRGSEGRRAAKQRKEEEDNQLPPAPQAYVAPGEPDPGSAPSEQQQRRQSIGSSAGGSTRRSLPLLPGPSTDPYINQNASPSVMGFPGQGGMPYDEHSAGHFAQYPGSRGPSMYGWPQQQQQHQQPGGMMGPWQQQQMMMMAAGGNMSPSGYPGSGMGSAPHSPFGRHSPSGSMYNATAQMHPNQQFDPNTMVGQMGNEGVIDQRAARNAAIGAHGLLQAGLQDRHNRSAAQLEAHAKETGGPLLQLDAKPQVAQAGLVGAIASHQKDRKREGGIGAHLTEKDRERRLAEARQKELDQMHARNASFAGMGGGMPFAGFGGMAGMQGGPPGGGFGANMDPAQMQQQMAMLAAQNAYLQAMAGFNQNNMGMMGMGGMGGPMSMLGGMGGSGGMGPGQFGAPSFPGQQGGGGFGGPPSQSPFAGSYLGMPQQQQQQYPYGQAPHGNSPLGQQGGSPMGHGRHPSASHQTGQQGGNDYFKR